MYIWACTGLLLWFTFLTIPPGYGQEKTPLLGEAKTGQLVYERSCAWCHGVRGKGDGPAAFFGAAYRAPRARDFTTGNFKFRSTPSGSLPTDQDLFRIVTQGISGHMPSFSGLSAEKRWAVIVYIKSFLNEWEGEEPIDMDRLGPPIPYSTKSVEQGKALYFKLDCQSCHGKGGRGVEKGTANNELRDSRDFPTTFLNLTNPFRFKNGSTAQDIVRTLMTGLDGSPMPSYADQLKGQEQQAWNIANYLLSLRSNPQHP